MYTEEKEAVMEKQRLSFDMNSSDHKYLKMCCAKLGVSIKDFMINATLEAIYRQEDIWFGEIEKETQDVIEENYTLIDHQRNLYDI